jgi:hypothetical protein
VLSDTLRANRDRRSNKPQREHVMSCIKVATTIISTATFLLLGAHANAAEFSAHFSGFQEIGGLGAGETGAIFSHGKGTLDLDLNRNARTINFKLTYSGLSSRVTQAHIHFGKVHVAGGIMVFFCSNLLNPPPGTQACPLDGGTVTGTFTPASVVGPTAQGITAGDFDALVAAITSNTAYGNIHTVNFSSGEIRGQVRRDDDRD